jgi:hypothetical protein
MSLIGTKPTCRDVRVESAFGGKPDLTIATADFRNWTQPGSGGCIAAVGTMSIFAAEGRAIHAADYATATCFARLVQRFTALRIVE